MTAEPGAGRRARVPGVTVTADDDGFITLLHASYLAIHIPDGLLLDFVLLVLQANDRPGLAPCPPLANVRHATHPVVGHLLAVALEVLEQYLRISPGQGKARSLHQAP